MKLKPMADNVLLKQHEAAETTVSGIILATTNKEKPAIYEVVAVGPGTKDVTMTVNAGDKVVVSKFVGGDIKLDPAPSITVKRYDLYKPSEVGKVIDDVTVTNLLVGERKFTLDGENRVEKAPTILEKVTFNDNGTAAYSDKKSGNILNGKVIVCAAKPSYNSVAIVLGCEGGTADVGNGELFASHTVFGILYRCCRIGGIECLSFSA